MKRFFTLIVILVTTLSVSYAQNVSQVLIKNVNVFDGVNEKLQEGLDVLVEKNLIKEIGKNLTANSDATVIDGTGKTLIPGLIDAHWHRIYAYVPHGIYYDGDISEVAIYYTFYYLDAIKLNDAC